MAPPVTCVRSGRRQQPVNPRSLLNVVHRILRAPAPLPLDRVARTSGWSPFHLHRAFRATVGETPHRFQIRLRLQRALVQWDAGDPDNLLSCS